MGILLDGGFDTQRQGGSGTHQSEGERDANPGVTADWNLVLSFGDLSAQTGYRTRVLGEFEHLDSSNGLEPFLLLFDRNPEQFKLDCDSAHSAIPRGEVARFFLELEAIARKKPVRVVHAHNLYSAALALSARRFYGYRVVLDYHGRIQEESDFPGGDNKRLNRLLELIEGWVLRHVNHVVVVSRALGRYVMNRYGIPASKLSVIPSCADPGTFHRDVELRQRTRSNLGLTDSLICTHLGNLSHSYESELLAKAFSEIRQRYPMAHLLAVTPKPDAARTFLAARLASETFTVTTCAHDQAPALLSATDLGFLLLGTSPNIETSSPSRFAEYLNCGVPVIITNGVGDFSSLVTNKRIGEVLKESTVSDKLVHAVLHSRSEIAARCIRSGQELTWQFHRDTAKHVF